MQKVLISFSNNTLKFSYKNKPSFNYETLTMTNVIEQSELTFSKNYIRDNQKLVALFVKELCEEKNLYRVSIETLELALFVIDLLKNNNYITAISILENTTLSYALYEKIIENKNINYVEASSIQKFMIELLDKKGIRAEIRNEIFYSSNFMQSNNLTNYSKIFYKMNVRINKELSDDDGDDFLAFVNINKYLKTIHLEKFNKKDLEFITNLLIENKIKNIRVIIYENIKDVKLIEYLKKTKKKLKKHKINLELVYSREYLKENLSLQILNNTLKICGFILFGLVISIVGYVTYSNYKSLQEVTKIQDDVKIKISEKINSNNNDDEENIITSPEKVIKNDYITSLYPINNEVVGWLKVNNTEVDYPVLQHDDNEYYLKHNLYKEADKNGWIFMDFRNSLYNMDGNTIIYGHNMYYSSVMFGTLTKTIKKNWYSNNENLIINFDTAYESMKYKIFSIYKVNNTKDYLKTYFQNEEEFNNFVKLIKERSINDFKEELKFGDKILTLSTCTGENQRLVIHAKLIT